MNTEKCSKCGEIKSIDEFYRYTGYKNNINRSCKKCKSEYNKKYNKNPKATAKRKAQRKAYNQTPKAKAQRKAYSQKNKILSQRYHTESGSHESFSEFRRRINKK